MRFPQKMDGCGNGGVGYGESGEEYLFEKK